MGEATNTRYYKIVRVPLSEDSEYWNWIRQLPNGTTTFNMARNGESYSFVIEGYIRMNLRSVYSEKRMHFRSFPIGQITFEHEVADDEEHHVKRLVFLWKGKRRVEIVPELDDSGRRIAFRYLKKFGLGEDLPKKAIKRTIEEMKLDTMNADRMRERLDEARNEFGSENMAREFSRPGVGRRALPENVVLRGILPFLQTRKNNAAKPLGRLVRGGATRRRGAPSRNHKAHS